MNALKPLAAFGRHHIEDAYQTKANLLVLGKKPTIRIGAFQGKLPLSIDRSSNTAPNYGYDGAKYLFDRKANKSKEEAFWELQLATFPHHAKLIQETRKALAAGDYEVQSDLNEKGTAKAMEQGWFVLATAKGGPLVEEEEFVKWWAEVVTEKAFKYQTSQSPCWITGKLCTPLRVHPQVANVPGTGGKASVASYNEEVYKFRGRNQGENFPISVHAGRSYTSGLTHSLEGHTDEREVFRKHRYGVSITPNTTIILVPGSGKKNDFLLKVIPMLDSMCPGDLGHPMWASLEKVRPGKGDVHVILLKGSQGRVGLLDHEVVSETQLYESLCRIRRFVGGWPLTRFVKGTNEDSGLIPDYLHARVIWDLILGRPFAPAVLKSIMKKADASNQWHLQWVLTVEREM